jgi:hypothetical protein
MKTKDRGQEVEEFRSRGVENSSNRAPNPDPAPMVPGARRWLLDFSTLQVTEFDERSGNVHENKGYRLFLAQCFQQSLLDPAKSGWISNVLGE